jgi:hypothetical protein
MRYLMILILLFFGCADRIVDIDYPVFRNGDNYTWIIDKDTILLAGYASDKQLDWDFKITSYSKDGIATDSAVYACWALIGASFITCQTQAIIRPSTLELIYAIGVDRSEQLFTHKLIFNGPIGNWAIVSFNVR